MTDKPMTQTELRSREVAYWKEVSERPPPLWLQVLIDKTYQIVKSNVSPSDE